MLDDLKEIVPLTPQASKGVHKKLIVRLVPANFKLRNPFFISFNGMLRNNPYSIKNKKGTINLSEYVCIILNCPSTMPHVTAKRIIKV
ncbi:hypothetical protein ASE53_07685 [Bacillus sp. Root11]|nr:hypothetical protein ASE53_07685 [Bacillus sp. Root11]KRD96897.1 hypothetical protein ASE54_02780 [Bacillus sp. Root131]